MYVRVLSEVETLTEVLLSLFIEKKKKTPKAARVYSQKTRQSSRRAHTGREGQDSMYVRYGGTKLKRLPLSNIDVLSDTWDTQRRVCTCVHVGPGLSWCGDV